MKEYIVRCDNNKFTLEGEIVHCKDCEFCIVEEPISRGIIPDIYCRIWQSNVSTDDYCSHGEKQVTSKLNNPDDSLLTEDSEACKEQKSKLESDTISRYAAISIPILPKEARKKFKDYDDAFETGWLEALACVNMLPPVEPPKKVVAQIKVDTDELMERIKEEYEIKDRPECEDAISRADTIKAMCQECKVFPDDEVNCADCTEVAIVKGMPPVEPKRPKGEWVVYPKDAIDLMFTIPKCSNCGFESADGRNFCPECGADMRGDTENE